MTMRATIPRTTALWLAAAGLLTFFNGPAFGAMDAGLDREAASLAYENDMLRRQIELASGREFYFILSPAEGELRLMLEGIVLREFDVQEISLGRPRTWFRTKPEPQGWKELVHEGGELSPSRRHERVEMVAPSGEASEDQDAPAIPPLPEEAIPVPEWFRITYRDGLSLEIRSEVPLKGSGWLENLRRGLQLGDKMRAFFHLDRDAMRVRLILKEEDAAALYRSVPPDTKILVIRPPE